MTSSCVIGVEESWQVWLSTRKAIQVTVCSENFHYVTRSATDISAGKITLPCISGSIRNRIKETVRRKLLRNNCHSEVIGSIPQCSDTWSNADRWPLLKYHMLCNNCCWVKKKWKHGHLLDGTILRASSLLPRGPLSQKNSRKDTSYFAPEGELLGVFREFYIKRNFNLCSYCIVCDIIS